jgi:hypothetical protein
MRRDRLSNPELSPTAVDAAKTVVELDLIIAKDGGIAGIEAR